MLAMRVDAMEEGRRARRAGQREEARAAFARARDEAVTAGDALGQAEALCGLAQLAHDGGEVPAAIELYGRALVLFRRAEAKGRIAHAVRHIGDLQREAGRLADAERSYGEALALYRGDAECHPLDLANALRGYALLKEAAGERTAARAMWEEAGRLYESAGVQAGVAESRKKMRELAEVG